MDLRALAREADAGVGDGDLSGVNGRSGSDRRSGARRVRDDTISEISLWWLAVLSFIDASNLGWRESLCGARAAFPRVWRSFKRRG